MSNFWIPNTFTNKDANGVKLQQNFSALRAEADLLRADIEVLGSFGTYRVATQMIPSGTWTNLTWTSHLAGSDWLVVASEHLVRPDVNAVFRVDLSVWWTGGFTSTDLFASRVFVNGTTNLGENRASSVNSAPAQTTGTVGTTLNGSTDYVNAQVYQNTGSDQTVEARLLIHVCGLAT